MKQLCFLWKTQDSYLLPTASTEQVTSVPWTLSFPCHTSWWLQQLVRHNTLVLHSGHSRVLSHICLQKHDSASFWCHPDTSCTVLVCCPLKIMIFGRYTSLGCIKAAGASSSHLCQLAALFILFLFISHPYFISDDFYISEHHFQLTFNFSPQNLFTQGKATLCIGSVSKNNLIKLQ